MSPEERAKAVIKDLCATDQLLSADGKTSLLESLVATAIREACNEKLEEAAAIFEIARSELRAGSPIALNRQQKQVYDQLVEQVHDYVGAIISDIRSLKDTSP
jgi:hypothetical protein